MSCPVTEQWCLSHMPQSRRLDQLPKSVGSGAPLALLLRSAHVDSARAALTEVHGVFARSFFMAETVFDTPSWRLLHYAGCAHWSLLCDPAFNVRAALIDLAQTGRDVPAEWIGDGFEQVLGRIEPVVSDLDTDTARAVWLVLAFIQSLHLAHNEVFHLPFWRMRVWKPALDGFLLV